ncbi:uncharacterized protein BCR38DRAFT_460309 [Pseudomassariella vexata]|uniref:RTA1 like protein-domain-containing protein n=1 Tax=Pseudomassariella vexata TaxID=1141098 RepID=A0A1Y2DKD4_9PEZI|nr:uncharacterized protein BCR38DRAFT_460309 [Pseudomassariella vexata]ORY59639.1 hypothetical protein BCR38DRAFT_460309 [Pseudomassariella vexata]
MAETGEAIWGSLYVYAPNKGAPIFFTIAYAISAIFHRLTGLHPFCAVLFTIGYATREYGAYNYIYSPTNGVPLGLFMVSQICVFIGPPFLELANYHVLSRVFYYMPYASPLSPGRVTTFFGSIMFLVEGLNAAGVALSSNAKAKEAPKKSGHSLVLVALALQVFVIFVFVYFSVTFHRRCIKARVPGKAKAVNSTLITLYMSMTLIFVRCIYRLVENAMGTMNVDLRNIEALKKLSPLLRYVVFFYIFKESLMLINSVLWNVRHPGPELPQDHHIYLAPDGTEVEGEVDANEHRPLLLKVANAMMFGLLFRNNKPNSHAQSQELDEYPHVNGYKECGDRNRGHAS